MSAAEKEQTAPYETRFKDSLPGLPGGDSAVRESAFKAFSTYGFPAQKREAWRYTKLAPLAKADFAPMPADKVSGDAVAPNRIADEIELVFIAGQFSRELSVLERLPEGVRVESLAQALADGETRFLGEEEMGPDEALMALNTAFASDGAVISLEDNARLDAPIHLLFIATGEGMAHPRIDVQLGKNSAATLVETYVGEFEGAYWMNTRARLQLNEGARLRHFKIQDEQPGAYHIAANEIDVAESAHYEALTLQTGGAIGRNEQRVRMGGAHAHCSLNGVTLGRGAQVLDTITRVDHAVPDATSDQMFKTVLDENARGVFQGKVIVARDAQHTDARQANHNLLLARSAEADTKPELEIYADDVQCAHGATVGEIDQNQLFYLRSRGLPEAKARQLLVEGFVMELLDGIENKALYEHFARRIAAWLEAEDA